MRAVSGKSKRLSFLRYSAAHRLSALRRSTQWGFASPAIRYRRDPPKKPHGGKGRGYPSGSLSGNGQHPPPRHACLPPPRSETICGPSTRRCLWVTLVGNGVLWGKTPSTPPPK